MFTDSFIDNLPDDPIRAAYAICEQFTSYDGDIPEERESEHIEEYLTALGVLEAFAEAYSLNFDFPKLEGNRDGNTKLVRTFFYNLQETLDAEVAKLTVEKTKVKFAARFKRGFIYEFTEGDIKRIQELINELRSMIVENNHFEEEHRSRLLSRLESVQQELHKKLSSLDKLWGLVGEAGVVMGKFGKDAKPLVERIKEIAQITWRTQSRAEELPSDSPIPQLESEDCDEID